VGLDHAFAASGGGNATAVIGVVFALIVIGILVFFAVPWVGIIVGVVGVILGIAWLLGFGGRAARGEQPQQPR